MKIDHRKVKTDLAIKRFYVPIKVSDRCPDCSTTVKMDLLNEEQLSYPTVNGLNDLYFYCNNCDEEWTKEVKLTIKLEEIK